MSLRKCVEVLHTLFLLVFLPFPLWVVQALHVTGSTATFSAVLIVAFGSLLVRPLLRMPRTSAVFNVDRDRAARRPTPSGGGRVYIR